MEEVENVWNTFSRYDPMDGGGRAKQEARAESDAGRQSRGKFPVETKGNGGFVILVRNAGYIRTGRLMVTQQGNGKPDWILIIR